MRAFACTSCIPPAVRQIQRSPIAWPKRSLMTWPCLTPRRTSSNALESDTAKSSSSSSVKRWEISLSGVLLLECTMCRQSPSTSSRSPTVYPPILPRSFNMKGASSAKARWVPNIPQSLELPRSCANLTMSGPPSFSASSHPPCAPHTCQHITGLWSVHRRPRWGPHPLDVSSQCISIVSTMRRKNAEGSLLILGLYDPAPSRSTSDPKNFAIIMAVFLGANVEREEVDNCEWKHDRDAVVGVTTKTQQLQVGLVAASWCLPLPPTLFPTVSCVLSLPSKHLLRWWKISSKGWGPRRHQANAGPHLDAQHSLCCDGCNSWFRLADFCVIAKIFGNYTEIGQSESAMPTPQKKVHTQGLEPCKK